MSFTFHSNHGTNIRLLENGTIAHRIEGNDNGMVFTKQPIPVGTMFELTILDVNKSISAIGAMVKLVIIGILMIINFIISNVV